VELDRYWAVVVKHRWSIIITTAVVALAALGLSFLQPPAYEGKTTLLVSPRYTAARLLGTEFSDLSPEAQGVSETHLELIRSRAVIERAIAEKNLGVSADDLLRRVRVTRIGQSDLVTVVATDRDAAKAAASADAVASAYIGWSQQNHATSYKRAADALQERLDAMTTRVTALRTKLSAMESYWKSVSIRVKDAKAAGTSATPGTSTGSGGAQQKKVDALLKSSAWAAQRVGELNAQIDAAKTQSDRLVDRIEALREDEESSEGDAVIVAPSVVGTTKTSPKPLRNGILGLAVGFLLGIVLAFAPERARVEHRPSR